MTIRARSQRRNEIMGTKMELNGRYMQTMGRLGDGENEVWISKGRERVVGARTIKRAVTALLVVLAPPSGSRHRPEAFEGHFVR